MTLHPRSTMRASMQGIRVLISRHRAAAMWLAVLALLVKALVPAGYMVGQTGARTFDIIVCSDPTGMPVAQKLVIPFENKGEHDGKRTANGDCAFTSLGHSAAPAVDPELLLAAIAFILALGFTSLAAPSLRGFPHLRPPLRGPPATA